MAVKVPNTEDGVDLDNGFEDSLSLFFAFFFKIRIPAVAGGAASMSPLLPISI